MLAWCAETAIVTGILAIIALAIGRHRPVTPAVKHALWLVVLIKFVTPPLFAWPWAIDFHSLEWPHARATSAVPVDLVANKSPAVELAPASEVSRSGESDSIAEASEREDEPAPAIELAATSPAPETRGTDEAPAVQPIAAVPAAARDIPAAAERPFVPDAGSLLSGILIAWLIVSVTIAIGQAVRIIRFRRRLRSALAAPDFLIDEADRIGHWLGVTVPDLRVVDDLGTPMLWCLGRPQLLLPTRLVKTLSIDRWRGILTHELAHLRRGDHWVSRLELATGLFWWWNPLYWLTRSRLDAEAELACDAWVVWALPKDRLAYAETLFDICSTMSLAKPMAPTLSVAGSGRFFERRLTMILNNRVPCRLSPAGLLAAFLLLLVALPSWSAATLVARTQDARAIPALGAPRADEPLAFSDDDDKQDKAVKRSADDDEDDDADADDDDSAALARAKARADAARARVEAIERKLEAARGRNKEKAKEKEKEKAKAKESQSKSPGSKGEIERNVSKLEKEIESKFGEGSEFAEKMAELGERIGKELDEKLGSGSEFEKAMEKLGETIGKEMEAKLGPGSEFEKKMKKLGKELEEQFGEGSDFVEKMKEFGKELESKFGPGSEFEQKMKQMGEEIKDKERAAADQAKKLAGDAAKQAKEAAKAHEKETAGVRERQIDQLEAQVAELMKQIKSLKSQSNEN
jgi:beta-lactamase regulating signal transducer with metallopeptidase domain